MISITGCRQAVQPLPDFLISTLDELKGPVRFTWYLSPELENADHLKAADSLLGNLVASANRRNGEISGIVRGPMPGERQPGSLLPLPATDENGTVLNLWSSLVIDWRDRRVVIPDVWETGWLSLDLTRALQDLAAGGPMRIGILDGSPDQGEIPVSTLAGRWDTDRWFPETSTPDRFQVLLLRDGPELLGYEVELITILETFLKGGGGVLVISSPEGEGITDIGEWAADRGPIIGPGRVYYIDDENILNPGSLRELDAALLLCAGRTDLISMMVSDLSELEARGQSKAGSRLLRAAADFSGPRMPPNLGRSEITFRSNTDSISFSLVTDYGRWFLDSGDWRLPARADRVESFLRRLEAAGDEIWFITDIPALLGTDVRAGPVLLLRTERGRALELKSAGERSVGGGIYVLSEQGVSLWPMLNAGDISGDARYWMERRLFPKAGRVIRIELGTDSRLYWRLHEEDGDWILGGRNGSRTPLGEAAAGDFSNRLLRSESVTIAPDLSGEISPLILMVEYEDGRRSSYNLVDTEEGPVAAVSEDGILHILDESLVAFILNGPAGS